MTEVFRLHHSGDVAACGHAIPLCAGHHACATGGVLTEDQLDQL